MNNTDNDMANTYATGISFAGLLTLIFIVLKLCGKITWSWIWILSPLWINFALIIAIIAIMFIFTFVLCIISCLFGRKNR